MAPGRRKVLLALLGANLVLVLVGHLVARTRTVPIAHRVRIGLVFDVGGLGDESFNDAANRGLEKAEAELDIEVRRIEPGDGAADRETAVRELAAGGYDLVIGVGFIFSEDMRQLARRFPRTFFACVDYAGSAAETPPNLAGLAFREQEGSYLAGGIAALASKSHTVGFVGGMQIPLIKKFEKGYVAGVHALCPGCTVLVGYAGTTGEAFANPAMGKELALSQIGKGADVIFHAAGKTGDGVFTAVQARHVWAIGVDSNQRHAMPCCVISSMVKGVDVAVFEAIKRVVDGRFRGGTVVELGLAEHGVDVIWDDLTEQRLGPAGKQKIDELRQRVVSGAVKVPYE
jgi:basic membrane protein A